MTRIVPSMVAPHNFFRSRMPQLQEFQRSRGHFSSQRIDLINALATQLGQLHFVEDGRLQPAG